MQYDVLLLRAVEGVPPLLRALDGSADARTRQAMERLEGWDRRMDADSAAAAVFEVFLRRWTQAVAAERFTGDLTQGPSGDTGVYLAGGIGGLVLGLLDADQAGWFAHGDREQAIRAAFEAALDELAARLGPDMALWQWGRLHRVRLRHPLSGHGGLSELLDRGDEPVGGNGATVGNTGSAPDYSSAGGANYRLLSDLAESPPRLWAVDVAGQSGHPGSPHYSDQLADWLSGAYQAIPLDREGTLAVATAVLTLEP